MIRPTPHRRSVPGRAGHHDPRLVTPSRIGELAPPHSTLACRPTCPCGASVDMPGHLHLLASRPSHASHPNERNRGYDEAPEPSHPQEGEESMERPSIRLAIGQFNELTDEKLRFAEQIGVRS